MLTEEIFTALDWIEHGTARIRVNGDRFDLSGSWTGEGALRGALSARASWTADARNYAGVSVTLALEFSDNELKFRLSHSAFSVTGTFAAIDCTAFTVKCKALGQLLDPNDCD